MSYCEACECSKGQIDRAGEALKSSSPEDESYANALAIVNNWRACHAYPINTFKSTLRKKVIGYNKPIVAQRLKRLSTIIDKLNRYPDMRLSRMNDIGGIRAVVDDMPELRKLQKQYKDKSRFSHKLNDEDDYINHPKSDGYRGIHLVYKYNNTLARKSTAWKYEGLLVELQIRTKLQHDWATAVETIGFLREEALKSQSGSRDWLKFFELVSCIFAYTENTPLVPGYEGKTMSELVNEVTVLANKLNAIDFIKGFSLAAKIIQDKRGARSGYYNLIVLNIPEKRVQIKAYKESDLKAATRDYAAAEAEIAKGANIEAVLVSAGALKSLKLAYPNYFLDIRSFAEKVKTIIDIANSGV